jgi:hypothetical protein
MSMQDWTKLCAAAGIDVSRMELMEIYLTAGRILNDEPLRKRALEFLNGSVLPADSRIDAIGQMTMQERLELRERVTGIVPIKKE